ncbi:MULTISPECIES: phage holin [Pontibacillus]|uniref:Phage holin n=1 Tax=Pontibacillus chungwhensis TaxID=265426 RepID=A0ABY8V0K4_9BACI|nr:MULTISPECIES: phage holin [Pontibacillus]MCD5324798.1 SPP1 phage holin family protein [Pontibacillus sp. HN14]WIF98757.1 phage holin [Pontibacillus chungwhensis]
MKEKAKEFSILVVGFLSAIMGFLATLNIKFQWLTEASIDAFGAVIVAAVMLISGAYAVWKNTFVSKKGLEQKNALKEKGLK